MSAALFALVGVWSLMAAWPMRAPELRGRLPSYLFESVLLATFAVHAGSVAVVDLRDRAVYFSRAELFADVGLLEGLRQTPIEPAFVAMLWVVGAATDSESVFGTVWICLVLTLLVASLHRLLRPWEALAALVVCTASPTLLAYATVTVRQGVAMSLLALGVSLRLTRSSTRAWVAVTVVSVLVHWSAAVPALSLVFLGGRRLSVRMLLQVYLLATALFLFGINRQLFGRLAGYVGLLSDYTNDELLGRYEAGVNRLDFLVVTSVIVVVVLFLYGRSFRDDTVGLGLVQFQLLVSIYFLLFGFIYFSDRVAAYSWFFAPICLSYLALRSSDNRIPYASAGVAGATVAGFLAFAI